MTPVPERRYFWRMVGGNAGPNSFLVGTPAQVTAWSSTFYAGATGIPLYEVTD